MRNDDTIFGNFYNTFGNFVKLWCVFKHVRINACKIDYKGLNVAFWINQRNELICDLMSIELIDRNLSNTLFVVLTTCGFYVYYCVYNSGFRSLT